MDINNSEIKLAIGRLLTSNAVDLFVDILEAYQKIVDETKKAGFDSSIVKFNFTDAILESIKLVKRHPIYFNMMNDINNMTKKWDEIFNPGGSHWFVCVPQSYITSVYMAGEENSPLAIMFNDNLPPDNRLTLLAIDENASVRSNYLSAMHEVGHQIGSRNRRFNASAVEKDRISYYQDLASYALCSEIYTTVCATIFQSDKSNISMSLLQDMTLSAKRKEEISRLLTLLTEKYHPKILEWLKEEYQKLEEIQINQYRNGTKINKERYISSIEKGYFFIHEHIMTAAMGEVVKRCCEIPASIETDNLNNQILIKGALDKIYYEFYQYWKNIDEHRDKKTRLTEKPNGLQWLAECSKLLEEISADIFLCCCSDIINEMKINRMPAKHFIKFILVRFWKIKRNKELYHKLISSDLTRTRLLSVWYACDNAKELKQTKFKDSILKIYNMRILLVLRKVIRLINHEYVFYFMSKEVCEVYAILRDMYNLLRENLSDKGSNQQAFNIIDGKDLILNPTYLFCEYTKSLINSNKYKKR